MESDVIVGGYLTRGRAQDSEVTSDLRVSIITPTYNSSRYLERTILSVLNQTYQNIELIIIDGGSTDATVALLKKYDNRIAYWQSSRDSGIYDAMNRGSKLATGEYSLYLNSDDYLYATDSIEKAIRQGTQCGNRPNLIMGKMIFAVEDCVFPDWVYPMSDKVFDHGNPSHQGTLIKSELYKSIPYNIVFKYAGDFDFWQTLRDKGLFDLKYVDCTLSVFTMGGTSNCGRNEFAVMLELEISRYMHFRDFRLLRLAIGYMRAKAKSLIVRMLGTKRYYRYWVYPSYLLKKSRVR